MRFYKSNIFKINCVLKDLRDLIIKQKNKKLYCRVESLKS